MHRVDTMTETKTEEYTIEDGKVYQTITIKREVSESELLNFKSQLAAAEANLASDQEKASKLEAKFNELK